MSNVNFDELQTLGAANRRKKEDTHHVIRKGPRFVLSNSMKARLGLNENSGLMVKLGKNEVYLGVVPADDPNAKLAKGKKGNAFKSTEFAAALDDRSLTSDTYDLVSVGFFQKTEMFQVIPTAANVISQPATSAQAVEEPVVATQLSDEEY